MYPRPFNRATESDIHPQRNTYLCYANCVEKINSLRTAILATFHYFDLERWPLTFDELTFYLYGFSAERHAIKKQLGTMPEIEHKEGFYFLRGRSALVEKRKQSERTHKKLLKRTFRFRSLFAACPFVRAVALCNSVSVANVHEKSDIDLFIITEKNRLYAARFFMKCLTQLFAKRVHHKKVVGRFCLSFFVTENAVNLQPLALPFDPHLGYFVLLMRPLFGKAAFKKFLAQNHPWTLPYFARPIEMRHEYIKESVFAGYIQKSLELILNSIGDFLESIFYTLQHRKDLRDKKNAGPQSSAVLEHEVFKFHAHDRRSSVQEKFRAMLKVIN